MKKSNIIAIIALFMLAVSIQLQHTIFFRFTVDDRGAVADAGVPTATIQRTWKKLKLTPVLEY